MKATPTLSLIHDIASLNPFRHPLQTGEGPKSHDHCTFCGVPMNARPQHDPTCLWQRAVLLFGRLVPLEAYHPEDYQ